MKPIVLHPGSVVVGVAVACVGLFVASAQTPKVESVVDLPPRVIEHLVVGVADPREIVVVAEGSPVLVPAGKLLVVTGVGATTLSDYTGTVFSTLKVDGTPVFQAHLTWNFSGATSSTSLQPIPPHLTVPSGATVEVTTGGLLPGRAWGYLMDE